MKISAISAAAVLRQEANYAASGPHDTEWVERVERLSQLCAEGISATHIAFLGTSILAKSVDTNVDLFAIKPNHASGNENAYSARSLCHSVLVPISAELGINIGVTGREPLNNQPYFRMTYLGDGTPVHSGGLAAFNYMIDLVEHLQVMTSLHDARMALRAFIAVRQRYQPRYSTNAGSVNVTPESLAIHIARFVAEDSEGGRRAQATVAGMLDIFAGSERVESGRINDPSRKYPGDVCIRAINGGWEKAIEVRDKNVRSSDIQIFGKKCVNMGVREAAIVMAAPTQERLEDAQLIAWAAGFGIGLTMFYGWGEFVQQALFWAAVPKPEAAIQAAMAIECRLIAVEASPGAVAKWQDLMRG